MDQFRPWGRGGGVLRRGLSRLRKTFQKGRVTFVQGARQRIGDVVGQRRPCQHEAPGADRVHGGVLPGIAAGGQSGRFQETVFGADARGFFRRRRDEAPAFFRHRREAGPADAAAPQRRGAAVEHHGRPVAGFVEKDRLEILVLIEPEPVEHVARQDGEPRALGAERHRLALEIVDRARRTVAAHHEHAGGRIHRGDDLQIDRARPMPSKAS